MGILTSDKVVKADRTKLIGKYLGSTSIKTLEVLKSANGGVLLIDEVYSLGNKGDRDSFSKECIDTINQYLSEHVDEFICIIAGYKYQVEDCFFSYNPGLERRFPWKFSIDEYNCYELAKIMRIQILDSKWGIDDSIDNLYLEEIIKNNKEYFSGNGGSTKNFIDKCKISHARRVFTEIDSNVTMVKKRKDSDKTGSPNIGPYGQNKIINKQDIKEGIRYIKTDDDTKNNSYINSMYI